MAAKAHREPEPIIIIKKVKAHGGHHGGAWKVAYADFVTAMMALFIVLWLLSSSEETKKVVGGYFADPTGSGKLMGTTQAGSGEAIQVAVEDLEKLKQHIEKAMAAEIQDFSALKNNVSITITPEGLRIELLENDQGVFFQSGNAMPSAMGAKVFEELATQLGALPNIVVLEGHTDAKPFGPHNQYSNWELSTDRANSARRLMQVHGLRAEQVAEVRGYADQQLRKPAAPEDASNRRISILVRRRFDRAAPLAKAREKVEQAAKRGEHATNESEHKETENKAPAASH
jgi:chemotaxis protein MotB